MDKAVAILGVGMHEFGRFPEKSALDMGREAAIMALKDADLDYGDIECGFCAHWMQPMTIGSEIFCELGMTGIPCSTITGVGSACTTRAVEIAAGLIIGGAYDTCLVIGVEKMSTPLSPQPSTAMDYYGLMGLRFAPGTWALTATRHMHLYGTTHEHFAQVAVKSHRNACDNPYAQYRKEVTLEEVLNSRMIAYPIRLLECSPITDGATAVVLTSLKKARQHTTKPVRIIGWGSTSPVPPHSEDNAGFVSPPGMLLPDTTLTASRAYENTGVGPKDIDVAEVHDAFAPSELFFIEGLGFCPLGEGGPFTWEGNTERTGKIPVNPGGGDLSRGNPIGAVGGAMIAELTWQLRGQAGSRQVQQPKVALQQNSGGGGEIVMIYSI